MKDILASFKWLEKNERLFSFFEMVGDKRKICYEFPHSKSTIE